MNQSGFVILIVLILGLVILGFAGGVIYLYSLDTSPQMVISQPFIPTFFPSPTEDSRPVYTSDSAYRSITIKHVTSQGLVNIATISRYDKIVRWQNYLFYSSTDTKNNLILHTYNLNTGEGEIVANQKNEKNNSSIEFMQVIDNNLYFSFGGYLAQGYLYSLHLPPITSATLIYQGSNPSVQKFGDQYWIVGGEGDACWSRGEYALLDVNTNKLGPVIKNDASCGRGEEFVGIDNKNRVLLAGYDASPTNNNEYNTYVIAIPSDNPSVKEGVIARPQMPDNIWSIKYSNSLNELALFGDWIYVFDTNSNSLNKIVNMPSNLQNGFKSWNDNTLCFSDDQKHSWGINLSTKQVEGNPQICQNAKGSDQYDYPTPEQMIQALNLPSDYQTSP